MYVALPALTQNLLEKSILLARMYYSCIDLYCMLLICRVERRTKANQKSVKFTRGETFTEKDRVSF